MPEPRRVLLLQAAPSQAAAHSGEVAIPPAGFLAITGYCRQFYPETEFVMHDFQAEHMPLAEQVALAKQYDPDLIAMGARSFVYPGSERLARAIKEVLPATPIVLGGQHATLMPEETEYPDCFDCVIRGEGETGFRYVLDRLYRDDPLPRIYTAPYLPEDELTHDMAWDIIQAPESYARPTSPFYPDPMGSVLWSRGCPFQCAFCAGPTLWLGSRPRVRYRAIDSILRELRTIKETYGIRRLFVHDDTLNASPKKMIAILEAVAEADLGLQWYATGLRADTALTPPEIFPLLKRAGCRVINFGIESGSPEVLQSIHRRVTLEETERALVLAKEAGLKVGGTYTIGHVWRNPDGTMGAESEEDLRQTLENIRDYVGRGLLWSVVVSIIDPVPGSEVWDVASEYDLLVEYDLDKLMRYDRVRLNFTHPTLSRETIDAYYTACYRAAVFNPGLVRNVLTGIRSPADVWGLARVAWFMARARLFEGFKKTYVGDEGEGPEAEAAR